MIGDDLVARRVVGFGVVVVAADIVGGERAIVVRIGLAIGHPEWVPGCAFVASFEVAKEQFVPRFVVVVWLLPVTAILCDIGCAEAITICLHESIATAGD